MQAPHPPLNDYYGRDQDRVGWVRRLFDRTATDYDRVERLMALGSGSWYRRRALQRCGLRAGMQVLDVGVGTGLTAREAARIVGAEGGVLGVDPSRGMIESAKVPPGVRLILGSAEHIPAADSSVDFLSMGYALRHVDDLQAAFSEFRRVLKPGARLCLLEITAPSGRFSRAMLRGYMRGLVPFVARGIASSRETPELMRYYWDTIEACAPPPAIMSALREAGFVEVERIVSLGIFSEYCARRAV